MKHAMQSICNTANMQQIIDRQHTSKALFFLDCYDTYKVAVSSPHYARRSEFVLEVFHAHTYGRFHTCLTSWHLRLRDATHQRKCNLVRSRTCLRANRTLPLTLSLVHILGHAAFCYHDVHTQIGEAPYLVDSSTYACLLCKMVDIRCFLMS